MTHVKITILANVRKPLFWKHFPEILRWLNERGVGVQVSRQIAEEANFPLPNATVVDEQALPSDCDMIVAFGGDGTILRTVQLVAEREIPILGVNVGGLGFLTEIPLEFFETIFEEILEGKYFIEDRVMLEAYIEGENKPIRALNEIVIDKASSPRVIQITVHVDNKYLNNYIADGLLISTPTGSTGYSLSVGGPIVVPSTHVFIINPISPHSLTNRPVIVPDSAQIEATIFSEYPEIMITGDGRDVRFCRNRTRMKIAKCPYVARLVKHRDSDYFALLRSKLHWGEDFRNKERWSYHS